VTGAGFTQIGGYFSARVTLPQASHTAPEPTDSFTVEAWDGTGPEALFEQVHALSTEAFSRNAFYKPISRDAFLAMYMPLVPMLRKELIFFARRPDGTLAGFLFGVRITPRARAANGHPEDLCQPREGRGRHLSHAFHTAATDEGYGAAIHALIHDDNLSALRSATEGAHVFRPLRPLRTEARWLSFSPGFTRRSRDTPTGSPSSTATATVAKRHSPHSRTVPTGSPVPGPGAA
jgi:hypothetical protein